MSEKLDYAGSYVLTRALELLLSVDVANITPGSDAALIATANTALANGDSLRTPPTLFGDFKDAASEYKTAISEAEGALP